MKKRVGGVKEESVEETDLVKWGHFLLRFEFTLNCFPFVGLGKCAGVALNLCSTELGGLFCLSCLSLCLQSSSSHLPHTLTFKVQGHLSFPSNILCVHPVVGIPHLLDHCVSLSSNSSSSPCGSYSDNQIKP